MPVVNYTLEGTATNYAAKIRSSGSPIRVAVLDRNSGKQTQGFGLGKHGKATVYVRPHKILTLLNEGERSTRVKVKFSEAVSGRRVTNI